MDESRVEVGTGKSPVKISLDSISVLAELIDYNCSHD
jgi:hypothetical protein